MQTSVKIARSVYVISVRGDSGGCVVYCESYFLDSKQKHRVFEFKDFAASINPFPVPANAPKFVKDLRTRGSAAATAKDPSVPAEDFIREKIAEAFGATVTIDVRDRDGLE